MITYVLWGGGVIKLPDEPLCFCKDMLEKTPDHPPTHQCCHSSAKIPNHSLSESEPKLQCLYYPTKSFQHFDYIHKLTRECQLRNFREITPIPKYVILKIGIFGDVTEEKLKFISKTKGKRKTSKHHTVWNETPLLCFQKDSNLESAIKLLRGQSASHKILIKSDSMFDGKDEMDDTLDIVDENKEDIIRAITFCFEKPIHQILQNLSSYLTTEGRSKRTVRVMAEINAIRKQLVLKETKRTTAVCNLPIIECKSIVPGNMRDYLLGNPDINAFGIWRNSRNSTFKVFVKKATETEELKNELMRRDRYFFDEYPLDIEIGKLIEKPSLEQGDPIFSDNGCGKPPAGTLGGFVSNVKDEGKKYALTCSHIFPNRNQLAYAAGSDGEQRQIGCCVFTRSDASCDFAAVEINETFSNECDATFRRDDGKKINAHVYNGVLENVGFVHKKGAKTGVTQGYIISSEFYNKATDEGNRECIFLVKGTDKIFSDEGDSGSLVFSRPRTVLQNYVDIVGMVYANNQKVHDDVEIRNRTEIKSDNIPNTGSEMKNTPAHNQETTTTSTEDDGIREADNDDDDADDFSSCYYLYPALKLFNDDQGPGFKVKFKDDLSSSSSSSATSLSFESDDNDIEIVYERC